MTPEERQLISDLFRRLADLEREPRDPEAENMIRDGLQRAPHAIYALVQTTLLQDEALKAADQHIADLEEAAKRAPPPLPGGSQGGSFLGQRRANPWGGQDGGGAGRPGSVPSVQGGEPMGAPPGYGADRGAGYGGGGGYGGPPPGGPGGGPMGAGPMGGGQMGAPMGGGGGGGSFLGTAAAAAAGAIGGGMLLGGIRSAMAGHGQGPAASAFGGQSGTPGGSPFSGGDNSLSRDAGLNDVGSRPQAASQADSDYLSDQDQDQDDEQDADDDDDAYDDADDDGGDGDDN